MEELHNLKNEALALINDVANISELNSLEISLLGRKGKINEALQKLKLMKKEEKGFYGSQVNEIKITVIKAIENKKSLLTQSDKKEKVSFDFTLPGQVFSLGHLHPLTKAIREIQEIFASLGFVRGDFPEVDWDWYVFESLNMKKDHPARDEWETIFLEGKAHPKFGNLLLTTHTSNGQVREMERVKTPPIRMLNIGKCYRRQQDPTHTIMFHQFEGLVVDKGINIPHLKGTLDYFGQKFFGSGVKSRIRPFHFQFTEPSFEVDFSCPNCKGLGCRFCKAGWVEVGGAGMVHPNVLKNGGIDPTKYTGFAFGWGVERVLSLKPGLNLPDIRMLYSNDARFWEQF